MSPTYGGAADYTVCTTTTLGTSAVHLEAIHPKH